MAKQFPNPAEFYASNYYALVDSDKCTGCGECMTRCQMEAISINDNLAFVDIARCIGCGLCTTCTNEAVTLQAKDEKRIPPKNQKELYQQILLKKSGPFKTALLLAKYILGYKA